MHHRGEQCTHRVELIVIPTQQQMDVIVSLQ